MVGAFACATGSSDVLRMISARRNIGVQLRNPINSTTVPKDDMATGRATRIRAISKRSIVKTVNTLARRRFAEIEQQAEISSAKKITKHTFESSLGHRTRIVHKTREGGNWVG